MVRGSDQEHVVMSMASAEGGLHGVTDYRSDHREVAPASIERRRF